MSLAKKTEQKVELGFRPQVDPATYCTPSYLGAGRFASYACQISEIVGLHPQSTLEIGIGNGLVSYLLRKAGFRVMTMDIDPLLEPDIVGSVTHIPADSNAFDVVGCFEVLEHLPFDMFSTALQELHRITRGHVLLSLPDATRYVRVLLHLPRLGELRLMCELRLIPARRQRFTGEHYWEIGKRGFPLAKIQSLILSCGFHICRTYRVFEHPYHRMLVLEKTT